MNKTFKDPNTKYSDQGTPLAQASEALSAIGDVAETVDELTETVDNLGDTVEEMSEKVDLIPVPVVTDEGKVLTATDDGAYELADVDALPAIGSGDAGKVLTVNAGETGAEWITPSGGGSPTLLYLGEPFSTGYLPTVGNYTWVYNDGCLGIYADLQQTTPLTVSELLALDIHNTIVAYPMMTDDDTYTDSGQRGLILAKFDSSDFDATNPAQGQQVCVELMTLSGDTIIGAGIKATLAR